MIYSLNYTTHPIERVNQVVFEFLKNSISNGRYSYNLFPVWFRDVLRNSPIFNDEFKAAYKAIQKLDTTKRQQLFNEFNLGIDINSLCNETGILPVLTESYSDELHKTLNAVLKDRFYSDSLRNNQTLQINLGTSLRDHYIEFKKNNNSGRVCPFCGLYEYSILEGESKDDYDHWLYKAKYPLYAVNFSNLVPMCSKCNQTGVKGASDILHFPKTSIRRKFFYPYGDNAGIIIKVIAFSVFDSLNDELKKLYPYGYFNVCVRSITNTEQEQVNNWKSVFNIETRFNSFLSSHYNQLSDEFFEDYLPHNSELVINKDRNNLIQIVQQFKLQLGNRKRRTGVEIFKAYLDFICESENLPLLYTFFRINLAD